MTSKNGYVAVIGCRECGRCAHICPVGALSRVQGGVNIDHELCNLCMRCVRICPNNALVYMEV